MQDQRVSEYSSSKPPLTGFSAACLPLHGPLELPCKTVPRLSPSSRGGRLPAVSSASLPHATHFSQTFIANSWRQPYRVLKQDHRSSSCTPKCRTASTWGNTVYPFLPWQLAGDEIGSLAFGSEPFVFRHSSLWDERALLAELYCCPPSTAQKDRLYTAPDEYEVTAESG